MNPISSSVSVRGSRPMLIAWATIVSARPGITIDHRLDELVERDGLEAGVADRRREFERRQRVARRAGTLPQHLFDRGFAHVEPGVGGHPPNVLAQRVGVEQVELQVLGPAADRVGHLLRIGGGQHEHDVRRRLLERLEQRRLGRLGQHVHLVEDVHLVPARRSERRLLDEVAHGVDAVVARRVEFVDVVARAALDGDARLALTARLTVDRRSRS